MSHAAPPPPPPQGPPGEVWTIHAQEPPQPPRRSKAPAVIAASVAGALVIAGGGFAFVQADPLHLFGPGTQPAAALPATSVGYAAVDLDPSASQKVDAIRFLNTFPEFRDLADLDAERDDIRKELLNDLLEQADCPGVTYAETIEPWLGNRIGLAAVPGSGPEPDAVVAVEVTDEDEAQAGLGELNDCGTDERIGFTVNDGFALLAETEDIAQAAADSAADASLADDEDFKADMDALGEQGIATGWLDVAGLTDLMAQDADLDPAQTEMLQDVGQRMAATVRFDSDAVEMASVVGFDGIDLPSVDVAHNQIVDLPDSTLFALSASGGSEIFTEGWDQLQEQIDGDELQRSWQQLEDATGLKVPDDLATLLGDNLMFAVGADGLTPQAVMSGDLGSVDAGLRFTGDAAKLQDLYDRAVTYLEQTFGVQLPVSPVEVDDGLVLATNDDYAGELADLDGSLGESDDFGSVVDDAETQSVVGYLDFDALEPMLEQQMGASPGGEKMLENLRPLRAFGFTAQTEGDYQSATFRMSVED